MWLCCSTTGSVQHSALQKEKAIEAVNRIIAECKKNGFKLCEQHVVGEGIVKDVFKVSANAIYENSVLKKRLNEKFGEGTYEEFLKNSLIAFYPTNPVYKPEHLEYVSEDKYFCTGELGDQFFVEKQNGKWVINVTNGKAVFSGGASPQDTVASLTLFYGLLKGLNEINLNEPKYDVRSLTVIARIGAFAILWDKMTEEQQEALKEEKEMYIANGFDFDKVRDRLLQKASEDNVQLNRK